MTKLTIPQSFYPDLYIPALNNLWCHTGSTRPEAGQIKTKPPNLQPVAVYSYENTSAVKFERDLRIQTRRWDLVYDAAGEE